MTDITATPQDEAPELDETGTQAVETAEPVAETTFADFGVRQDIVDALAAHGITSPFPIQAMTLPIALSGQDIIGQAKTGTGKTLGFGIPALQRAVGRDDAGWEQLKKPGAPQALIVVPTRELAVQVGSDLAIAAKTRNARVATIYGGRPYESQIAELEKGVEVVVGTPGRLIDLSRQHYLDLSHVRMVVLDEADEMLDLGFLPDVEKLLASVPEVRQTMLFSATMPGPVVAMARRYMTHPMHIRAAAPDEGTTKKDIRQVIYRAHHLDKDEVVARILQAEGRGRSIIFTRTKRAAAKLADELIHRGFAAAPLHGDLGQGAREQALRAFRNGKVDVLVATDVAARGIDVEDVTHVINFQCPEDEKTYLHRTGRTGRAGNKGTAITFVDWDDVPRWRLIDKALELGIPEPVETYSSSEHLYTDLNIPRTAKGKLPRSQRTLEGLAGEELEDLGDARPARGDKRSSGGSRDGSGSRRRSGSSGGGSGRGDSGGSGRGRSEGSGRSGERSRDGSAGERTGGEGSREDSTQAPREKSVENSGNGAKRRRRRRRPSGQNRPAQGEQNSPAAQD
ncbi:MULTISPECIES: DEAD/DEAH box helicase [Kocuria]|uniref:RNA helicase n=2 Tax=Kocuria TaxID=57493 RepID=A0A7D7L0C2_KOCVA|nr:MULTISPECIES: DEAD/DEAH box helicase [Kocuria]QMS57565.1 DEAD-box ATP-dependent RNA helicase CshA [Kocuria varians]RUP81804.1 DEAD/DEAH box helicase [Kocuria sp. HSID17590]